MGWLSNLFGGKKTDQVPNTSVIQDLNRPANVEKTVISGNAAPDSLLRQESHGAKTTDKDSEFGWQESVMAAKASFEEMPELNTAELKNVMSGRKVIAIKLYRDRTNVSLKAAKEYIDYVETEIETGTFPKTTKDQES